MKRNIPAFFSGALTTALVGTIAVSALAASGRMTIEVDPINVQVNGEVFQPTDANGNAVPVFVYQGTTYAPLRALAEAYGLEVGYDKGSNMATVMDPESKPTNVATVPEPTETPVPVLSEEWTDTDEAFYKQLTEEWEYTLLTYIDRTTGDKELDNRVAYLAEPKTNSAANFDWESFGNSDSSKKIAAKIAGTVNTTDRPNTVINYSGGWWLFVYEGNARFDNK